MCDEGLIWMWNFRNENLPDIRGFRFVVEHDSQPATVADVIRAWQSDAKFGSLFTSVLANVSYAAFRWETPPVISKTTSQPFEFVIIDSPGLDRTPDANAFAEHFDQSDDGVVVFPNLGRDATLIVPCPRGESAAYGHLATFVRGAPEAQQQQLWQSVAQAMRGRLSEQPVWLSTAGAGVPWLHVRLDDSPKYYWYAPYRDRPVRA